MSGNEKENMPVGTGIRSFIRNIRNKHNRKKLHISPTTTTNNLNLQTAITLYSEVIDIHQIHKGDFVGYGALYTAEKDMIVATIPIGYADGIPRKIKHVEINGKMYNVVGEICMDMIAVCVDSSVKLYDKVTVLGGKNLPIKKVANECGISSYALFTGITNRVPRVYINGQESTEINY